ncbi:MAG: hypothetical protein WCQ44_11700, partial [Opitutaceae bacterium]
MLSKLLTPSFQFLLLLLVRACLPAAVIGTNPESLPLTAARIAALPVAEQSDWRDYLSRSEA